MIFLPLDVQAVNQKKTAEKIIICEVDVQAMLWCFICMEFVLKEAGYKLIIPDKIVQK